MKEERNEQTPTICNSLKGLEKMCTHFQLQQFRKIVIPIILEKYIHTLSLTSL